MPRAHKGPLQVSIGMILIHLVMLKLMGLSVEDAINRCTDLRPQHVDQCKDDFVNDMRRQLGKLARELRTTQMGRPCDEENEKESRDRLKRV